MATTRWDALGFVALFGMGLLAAGGAAATPEGLLLGMPGGWAALAIAVSLAGLWWVGARGATPWIALLLVPAWLLGANLVSRGALSGPPLWSLFLAGVASLLVGARRLPPERLFFPAILLVYLVAAGRVQSRVGPEGDEPHYLMVADSLLRDQDLDVARDYTEGRYRSFHPRALEPHFRIRGRGGEIYSVHALGLSLLVLPAYAVAGYAGASFFMALLGALLAREIRRTLLAFTGRAALAPGVAWAVALSPPLLSFAGLLFTELPAALILAFGLRRARDAARLTPRAAVVWGASLAFLPWLNVRYSLFPLLLLAYALTRRLPWRSLVAAATPLVVSGLGIACYHFALYGFFDPRRVYGRSREFAFGTLLEGLPGLLLDQEFGLLIYAPLFALAVPGLWQLWRASRRDAVLVAALSFVVLLTAGSWDMWRGGFNPPARFLVPLVPALAIAVAFALARGFSASAALLVGWGLWTGLAGLAQPELVHRDRDGTAPFYRVHAGAEEWSRLLPGFVLADPDRRTLAVVWVLVLGLAVAARANAPTVGRVAISLGVLLGGVAASSRLSHARTEGRDAVRLVGRPALEIPAWRGRAAAPARWGPDALVWGPLYEPHRHPGGATLGARLRLAPGAYRLSLATDASLPITEPPKLLVQGEGPAATPRLAPFERGEGSAWTAAFSVARADAAGLRLAVLGGGPFVLQGLALRTEPTP